MSSAVEISVFRLLEKVMLRLRITPAIAWSGVGTLVSGLTGPAVAFLIARQFSEEMQGYYYTFNSLLAMSVFLELGFNGCIVQFISHEYAHVGLSDGKLVKVKTREAGRLSSLLRLSLRWYLWAALLLFIGVGVVGELFFRLNPTDTYVAWRGPWWCLCALSAINLMIMPLTALLDGCDQVNWTARARTFQNIGRSIALIIGLLVGLDLYAPAVASLCALVIYLIQFSRKWMGLTRQVLSLPAQESVSWSKEILPMQWRIAVSWASGYFIFSIFNPLLFSYAGAEIAGRFGMTWTILMAINAMSQSVAVTRAPRFGALIAKSEWDALRKIWRVAIIQAVLLNLVLSGVFVGLVYFLQKLGHPAAVRVIGIGSILPLCLGMILNQIVFTIALVARAEKREPFMWPSILVAVLTVVVSYLTVVDYTTRGVAYGYLLGSVIGLLCALFILRGTRMARGV